MFDNAQLEALRAVLISGSFDAAAHRLHVTPSAISQRIKALEDQVGTTLVIRAQPCRATPAGQRVRRHADALALLDRDLRADLALSGADTNRLPVRIVVNADSLAAWFTPTLAAATGLLVEVIIDDQDHSIQRLREGDVVAAITSQAQVVQGCDVTPLGAFRYLAVASPEFRRHWFPDGCTEQAFRAAPALAFNDKDRLQRDWVAGILGHNVDLPVHRLPSVTGFLEAAKHGVAWGLNPEPMARGALAQGALIELLPDHPLDTSLYWQVSRIARDALEPLTQAVRQAARKALVQSP